MAVSRSSMQPVAGVGGASGRGGAAGQARGGGVLSPSFSTMIVGVWPPKDMMGDVRVLDGKQKLGVRAGAVRHGLGVVWDVSVVARSRRRRRRRRQAPKKGSWGCGAGAAAGRSLGDGASKNCCCGRASPEPGLHLLQPSQMPRPPDQPWQVGSWTCARALISSFLHLIPSHLIPPDLPSHNWQQQLLASPGWPFGRALQLSQKEEERLTNARRKLHPAPPRTVH